MEVENIKKTIEIHDALTDPPKESGYYLTFVRYKDYDGGYWIGELPYVKKVNAWNAIEDPVTGFVNLSSAIDSVTHWTEAFDPNEEDEKC